MTSAGRISLAARRTLPQSGFVCLQCRLRTSSTVRITNPSVTLPYASHRHQSFFDTEKLRRKIWGSDTPPGQEDPYGEESVLDRRRREREQERERSEELQRLPKTESGDGKDQAEYVPATTIEGLETVGAPGWDTKQWVEKNPFHGFNQIYGNNCDIH